jgi:hypothetical protein
MKRDDSFARDRIRWLARTRDGLRSRLVDAISTKAVDGYRFLFFATASILLACIARYLGNASIPLVSIELVLLAPFLHRRVVVGLMLVSLLTASARVVQGLFGFDQLFISIPLLAHNITAFPLRYVIQLAVLLLAYLAGIALVLRLLPLRLWRLRPWMLAVGAVVLLGGKMAEDSVKQNLVGTQFGYLSGQFKFAGMFGKGYTVPGGVPVDHPVINAATGAIASHQNLWLIVVESMGRPADPSIRHSLLAPLLDNADLLRRYDISDGNMASVGSTIHGELRALCNGRLTNGLFDNKHPDCLPARMAAVGYATQAVHANVAGVYGRNVWYRNIGFQQFSASDTEPALAGAGSERWGTRLDGDTIAWLRRTGFPPGELRFEYLMTISTHLPADLLPQAAVTPGCLASATVHACEHLANLHLVLSQIAQAAVTLDNTIVVLVGDHPPPFVSPGSRAAFSATEVPWVRLTPKRTP